MHYVKLAVTAAVPFALILSGTSVFARGKAPDLTKACSKECPNVASNDEANSCIENLEKSQGEASFKKQHRSCYKAHERYEKIMGKQEAGGTVSPDQSMGAPSGSSGQQPGTSGSDQSGSSSGSSSGSNY